LLSFDVPGYFPMKIDLPTHEGPMPLSPRLLFLIGITWLSGLCWYWAHERVLKPSVSIQLPTSSRLLGVTSAGEAVTEHTNGEDAAGLSAPLEFWSLRTGRPPRRLLQAGDTLIPPLDFSSGLVCVKRDGRFLAIDLNTGETLDELPVETRAAVCDAALESRILYSTDAGLRLRDPRDRRDVWSNADFASWRGIGSGYIVVREARHPGFGSPAGAVRIADGQTDSRFNHLQPLTRVSLGPGDHVALVSTLGGQHVCDAPTGRLLWTLPGSVTQPQFSASGEHLTSVWTDSDGRFHEARWQADSGVVVSPPPTRQSGAAMRSWSPDARYSVDSFAISKPWLAIGSLSGWQATVGLTSLSLRWVGMDAGTEIRDHSTGRSLGRISHRLQPVVVLPDGSGAVTAWEDRIDFYAFPPRRNDAWLALWSLAPIPILWILSRVPLQRRRRSYVAQSSRPSRAGA